MIWVIALIFIIAAAIAIGITSWLHAWDSYSFWGMFIIIAVYIALIIFMVWYANYLRKKQEDKYNMAKAWHNAAEKVAEFPGGNTLEWAFGLNRFGDRKTYYKGTQEKNFMAFYARLSSRMQYIIVIWNCEEGTIQKIDSTQDPKTIADPWNNFKPFENADQTKDMNYDFRRRMNGRMPEYPWGMPPPDPDQSIISDFERDRMQQGEQKR